MPNNKLNFRITDLMRAALGIAMVDGGFVIGIQIINFLLAYFGARLPSNIENMQSLNLMNSTNFLIVMITMLNLSVIIYRITGLARGIKYSAATCYQHALRRWPALILLYMVGSLLILAVALPLVRVLNVMFAAAAIKYNALLMLFMLGLIPYGILACIFVIDQGKNPLQAIMATFSTIKNNISMRLMINLSLLYSFAYCINSLLNATILAEYMGLFNAVWFLFCHTLMIVIYASTIVKANLETNDKKPTKVIIV